MIESLIRALQTAKSEPSAREVADMLWLAMVAPQPSDQTAEHPDDDHQPERINTPTDILQYQQANPTPQPRDTQQSDSSIESPKQLESAFDFDSEDTELPDDEPISVYAPTNQSAASVFGTTIKLPAALPLHGEREISHALRPLRRRVADQTRVVLDEQATAQRSASARTLVPVTRMMRRRWLALDLVVDQSRSMVVWRDTLRELATLLTRQAAFRHIRLWSLDTNSPSLMLQRGIGLGGVVHGSHSVNEVVDPSGERLVLLFSDCITNAWRDGTVTRMIERWGRTNPVAIVQMLPSRLWHTTALGAELSAVLRATAPNTPNQRLHSQVQLPPFISSIKEVAGIAVPVVSLNPVALHRWTTMLTGKHDQPIKGYWLMLDHATNHDEDNEAEPVPLTGTQRADRFIANASVPALTLAYYLAWSPVLTLPIIRLIQTALVPDARQEHLAEVLVGGIMRQVNPEMPTNLDALTYDFHPDVRAVFQAGVSITRRGEIRQLLQGDPKIIEHLSAKLKGRTGYTNDMTAIIRSLSEMAEQVQVSGEEFAEMEKEWLRRIGVDDVVANRLNIQKETTENVPFQDKTVTQFQHDSRNDQLNARIINNSNAGMSLGQTIYGADLNEQRREQIVRYLERLANSKEFLRLRALTGKMDNSLSLPNVYAMLATDTEVEVARGNDEALSAYFDGDHLKEEFDPDYVLPDKAIVHILPLLTEQIAEIFTHRSLARSELVAEAVQQHQHLVLCGAPGSGKSTFLSYLAWVLARQGLDQLDASTFLHGWNDNGQRRLLPVMIALRTLAGTIKQNGASAAAISAALHYKMQTDYDVHQSDELLEYALAKGKAILLLDGLDEVPLEATETSADRTTTIKAVRDFAELHNHVRIVITCRTRAWTTELATLMNWHVATIAPITGGQTRYFIKEWYEELVKTGQIDHSSADKQHRELINRIMGNKGIHLGYFVKTPLLLTMLCMMSLEQGLLTIDRVKLYEEVIRQLLGQWDEYKGGQSLSQVIGDPRISSESLRPLLDRLSFEAYHHAASSDSGRGRITKTVLRGALSDFFELVGVDNERQRALRCIDYFDQCSGLLQPEDDGETYAFAHLTLQEYCAGRHLVRDKNWRSLIKETRATNPDLWSEPLMLGIGHLHTTNTSPEKIEIILNDLCSSTSKTNTQWYKDIIFAAEIGKDRDWDMLQNIGVDTKSLKTMIRKYLLELQKESSPIISELEYQRALTLLEELQTILYPMTTEQWLDSFIVQVKESNLNNYWASINGGNYKIGGWYKDEPTAILNISSFWMAKYPITIEQYQQFMYAKGYSNTDFWTVSGWKWKEHRNRQYPWGMYGKTSPALKAPVTGISWYEAMAFCAWLNSLQNDYIVRLPTEAEWEVATHYDSSAKRFDYPWGNASPSSKRAVFAWHDIQPPTTSLEVGSCPDGASSTGIFDLIGNVWEWTQSRWTDYPYKSNQPIMDVGDPLVRDDWITLCGGSWNDDVSLLKPPCRMSFRTNTASQRGFRLVLIPNNKK